MPAAIGTGRVIDKNLVLSGYQVPKGVNNNLLIILK